jgi:hypothetical protein
MSWKSLVITGLLCVVASPALAAPTATAKVLGLDTAGNWVWSVTVTPDATLFSDNPPNGVGGSIALEIGATASNRNLVSAGANATNFPANNKGVAPAAWTFWTTTDEGVEANVATNQVFAALGSTYFTTGGEKEAFRVHTQRPTTTALTTTLTLSGNYSGNGRLAQDGLNSDTVTGVFNKLVRPGNANLTANVDVGDLAIVAANYNQAGKTWAQGDFTGNGTTDVGDLAVLAANYNQADANWTVSGQVNIPLAPGAGSGGIAAAGVPEPTSIVMLALAGLAAAGIRRRS